MSLSNFWFRENGNIERQGCGLTYPYFRHRSVCVKFSAGDLYIMPLSVCEFLAYRLREGPTFLVAVYVITFTRLP
jgi:hypothetical protein